MEMNNFTLRAQQVLALARKEADNFNHNYVGTEHLVLALLQLSDADFALGLGNKLMGQVNLVRLGVEAVNDENPDVMRERVLLLDGEIDLAVHSYKDLPTAITAGLVIAAVPPRDALHDVLVSDDEVDLAALPSSYRIGTSSPRRAAQFRYFCSGVTVHPLRGNVPTRLAKLEEGELDAVVLAPAGLRRLNIEPEHAIDLPVERFVPAPAQGALAVQVREGSDAEKLVAPIDHAESRLAVDAERAFLRAIGAGCHTPAAAYATVSNRKIRLTAQLFSDDGLRMVDGVREGGDSTELGKQLAGELKSRLSQPS